MGASGSSTRVLTLDGDDTTVVTVSEAVARRLLGKETGFVPVEEKSRPPQDSPRSEVLNKDDLTVLESYYQRRLKSLESQHEVLSQIQNEQFVKTVKEVEDKFLKPLPSCSVCPEQQEAVTKCYKINKNSTLDCTQEVKEFRDCVRKHQEAMLERKG